MKSHFNKSKNKKSKSTIFDSVSVINFLSNVFTVSKAVIDEMKSIGGKVYVFDTNVLMSKPSLLNINKCDCIFVIPITVLEELDKLKLDRNRSHKASAAIKVIQSNSNKSNIRIEGFNQYSLPKDFDIKNNDNKILATAMKFINKNVIIVTDDNNLKNKAKSQNIGYMSLSEFIRL